MLLRAAVRRCGVGDWKSATGGERERSVPRSPIRAKGSSIAAAAKDRKRGKMNDATRARGGRRTACGCAPRCTWRRSGAGTATPPSPSSSCPSTRRTACHGAPARASSLRLGATCNGQCDLDGGKTRAPARRPRRVYFGSRKRFASRSIGNFKGDVDRSGRTIRFQMFVSHVYNCSLSVIHHDRDDHHKRTLLMCSSSRASRHRRERLARPVLPRVDVPDRPHEHGRDAYPHRGGGD